MSDPTLPPLDDEILITTVGRLHIEPGDTLVLTAGYRRLTAAGVSQLRERLALAFPDVPALVLDEGMTLGVASTAPRSEPAAVLREAAQDYRERVHDETAAGTWARVQGDAACTWLEQRADLIESDDG